MNKIVIVQVKVKEMKKYSKIYNLVIENKEKRIIYRLIMNKKNKFSLLKTGKIKIVLVTLKSIIISIKFKQK
jgi:asparagine N-glycosylation enzyme membrane subunit Stt3